MIPALERRLRQLRSRLLVRSWGYRQRHHAHGVWFRLRRVLADAAAAWAIPEAEARRLVAEGHHAEPVGSELQPPRVIVFVPPERVSAIRAARPLDVRLDAALLEAGALALVPFEPVRRESPGSPSRSS